MRRFELVTTIAAPPDRAFAASLDVEVHAGSMADSGERAIGGVRAGQMRLGDTVTWDARHFGVRWRMTSLISAYEAPVRFVDEQVSGPFNRWWHAHHFEPDGNGGTRMTDVVEFAAPLGPLGLVAEGLVLGRYMRRLIVRRNDYLRAVLESE